MEMATYLEHAPVIWLAIGASLIALEAFGLAGLGFVFAGLGAITAAILAHLGIAETLWTHTAWFFGTTAVWAALLWVPIKKWKTNREAGKEVFRNMVGDEVTVLDGGLQKGKTGKVQWSGTTMSARLADTAVKDEVEAGSAVRIIEVQGNMLIVSAQ